MHDEDAFLAHHVRHLRDEHQHQLAHQVELYHWEHSRFNNKHQHHLEKLRKAGCTTVLEPGTALSKEYNIPPLTMAEEMPDTVHAEVLCTTESEVEGMEDIDAEAVADSLELVLRIADNVGGDGGAGL
ncbi:hypothetical protein MSAN_01912500 [Mycena sanguinolenta]|uniref:Uncharacterized protein n=1 Tax=Mycena sanguinolenta TaxID=230812 RepID=A0A8H6XPX0_9AGAR|nr:hypothetical protein MSAN_01912500 [Mycena sanguinolenta]